MAAVSMMSRCWAVVLYLPYKSAWCSPAISALDILTSHRHFLCRIRLASSSLSPMATRESCVDENTFTGMKVRVRSRHYKRPRKAESVI